MKKIQAQALDSQPCYLVALIESEGSTPRTSGAYMLVGEKGLLYGTIGGGTYIFPCLFLFFFFEILWGIQYRISDL